MLPIKYPLSGVNISACDYTSALDSIVSAIQSGDLVSITALDAHGLSRAIKDNDFKDVVNSLTVVTPDGRLVARMLNWCYGLNLKNRVTGPELALLLLEQFSKTGIKVFFYGSTETVLQKLKVNLLKKFPRLKICGSQASRFRPLSKEEKQSDLEFIRNSDAEFVFVGLGCPRQEIWICENFSELNVSMFAIGAAFDFYAGTVSRCPKVFQNLGLEWIYRFCTDPKKLWPRLILIGTHVVPIATELWYRSLFKKKRAPTNT